MIFTFLFVNVTERPKKHVDFSHPGLSGELKNNTNEDSVILNRGLVNLQAYIYQNKPPNI